MGQCPKPAARKRNPIIPLLRNKNKIIISVAQCRIIYAYNWEIHSIFTFGAMEY